MPSATRGVPPQANSLHAPMLLALVAPLALAQDVVTGAWSKGDYVDLAVVGKDVFAVWLEGDTLFLAKGTDAPEVVAREVESGDGGQLRPEILASGGAVVVLYSDKRALKLAHKEGSAWTATTVSPVAATGPFLAAMAPKPGGGVVVAGLAWNGRASEVFVDGKVVFEGGADGVCMCCKPALFARSAAMVLAFRDADGLRRDIRTLLSPDGSTWTDGGEATRGGWSPGGCPSDGPALTETTLVVSDGRSRQRVIYEVDRFGEHAVPAADGRAERLQPRALPDASLHVWVEATPGRSNLVVRDGPGVPVVVATTAGRMEPGDPVVVGSTVWIPWQGETAQVVSWTSVAPGGM